VSCIFFARNHTGGVPTEREEGEEDKDEEDEKERREEMNQVTSVCVYRWVRALDREGILRQARYITSNSTGSWFNTAFSYQSHYTRAQFLGEYVEPKNLTPAAAKIQGSAEGSYAKAIAESNFLKVREYARR
jgi:hypothetical protein